ncbi:MAG: hypothetical protein IJM75_03825 [Ruminococcus sp.]|nr:hypothetical protein [Ruminococcus sp.]
MTSIDYLQKMVYNVTEQKTVDRQVKAVKEFLIRLLKPPVRAIILIDICAVPLTIIALTRFTPESPLSLIAYLLSSYALTVTIVNLKRTARRIRALITGDELAPVRGIKRLMRRHRYTRLYLESRDFRAETALYIWLAINLLFALFKGITGIVNSSAWLFSFGVYYLFLGVIRFVIMLGVQKRNRSKPLYNERKLYEYRVYRRCGCLVMILNIAMSGMAVQMIWQNKANEYSQAVVIGTAAYTFYCFISAIANVISFRRRDNAILSAAKDLNMIGAIMSMYSLQTSMLYAFGKSGEEGFRRIMNTATGIAVLTSALGIAALMIINGTKKIRHYAEKVQKPS